MGQGIGGLHQEVIGCRAGSWAAEQAVGQRGVGHCQHWLILLRPGCRHAHGVIAAGGAQQRAGCGRILGGAARAGCCCPAAEDKCRRLLAVVEAPQAPSHHHSSHGVLPDVLELQLAQRFL
eukprot:scaffold49292_cov13-Tisochrysis_lutea.AAC.1